jgi:small subunit ribosomal protein S2
MSISLLAEAKRLGITTFGMVDTNCDPNKVDFAIPANDDATKSIASLLTISLLLSLKVWLNVRLLKMKNRRYSDDENEKKQHAWKQKLRLKLPVDVALAVVVDKGGGGGGGGQRRRVGGGRWRWPWTRWWKKIKV